MKLIKLSLVALLAVFITSTGYAADIYKDAYTTEDSSGNWTMTGYVASSRKIDVITSVSDTPTLTAKHTGTTFILAPTSGTGPYNLELPDAAANLTFSFGTATGSTLSVIPKSGDKIVYLGLDAGDRITSPASSGSTVTLIGISGTQWYVAEMTGGLTGGVSTWTDGS